MFFVLQAPKKQIRLDPLDFHGIFCWVPFGKLHDNERSLFSIGHTVVGSEILHHRLDVKKNCK